MERSQTAYLILGMLAIESNQSGYDIRKTVACSVNYFWGESYGQIYPTLKRLAAEGLITAEPSQGAGKRQLQRYSITPAGHACLLEWLAKPFRDQPLRDEFLLKLFFAGEAPPAAAISQVREFQNRTRRLLAEVQELEKLARERQAGHPKLPFWMLTLSFGVHQIRSALEWSETALAWLTSLETPEKPHHGE